MSKTLLQRALAAEIEVESARHLKDALVILRHERDVLAAQVEWLNAQIKEQAA